MAVKKKPAKKVNKKKVPSVGRPIGPDSNFFENGSPRYLGQPLIRLAPMKPFNKQKSVFADKKNARA